MYQLKSKEVENIRNKILQEDQHGICPICLKVPKRPCLDHHHTKKIKGTGQIRGVLCSTCNVFIGKSENNCMRYGISQKELPDILRATAAYLEKEQYPLMHPSEAPQPKIVAKSNFKKLMKLVEAKYPKRKKIKYVTNKKDKPRQKLNQKLLKLYKEFDLEPKFYQ